MTHSAVIVAVLPFIGEASGQLQSLGDLGFTPADYPAIAEYTVKTYGDGKQLDALGPTSMADIIGIFEATESQSKR